MILIRTVTNVSVSSVVLFLAIVFPVSAQSDAANSADAEFWEADPASRQLIVENYENWLQAYEHDTLKSTFEAVATEVRFEPYTGIRRGAIGTAVAQSGNAIDQSLLLARLLRSLGYQVRFVEGTLDASAQAILLEGMYPPKIAPAPKVSLLDRYQTSQDKALYATIGKHYWVQVLLNGDWYSLDPSFPRATAGEAYGKIVETWAQPSDDLYQTVAISHHITNQDGTTKVLGSIGVKTAELGLAPIQLMIAGVPQIMPVKKQGSSPLGRLTNALAGSKPEPAAKEEGPPEPVAVEYKSTINFLGNTARFQSYQVPIVIGEKSIEEEWIEFDIKVPGSEPRSVKRWLFRSDEQADTPQHYRQYTISILPHQVPESVVEHQFELNKTIAWQNHENDANDQGSESAVTGFNQTLSASIGLLTNLSLAHEADKSSDTAAFEKGLVTVYATPRIYMQNVLGSLIGEKLETTTSTDLRLDEVESYPLPGYPSNSGYSFQHARGLRQSALERLVLEQMLADDGVVSTARVMQASVEEGSELLVIDRNNQDQFASNASYTLIDKRFLDETFAKGNVIVVPEKPVEIDGKSTVGWWEIEKTSGRIIGVMESGEHQATAEAAINLENPVQGMNGYALGMISGANSTQMLIMAGILANGEITAEHIEEMEEILADIVCTSCPSASAGFSASAQTDCINYFNVNIGVSTPSLPFCDGYGKGFECAVSMIFSNIRGDSAYTEEHVAGVSFGIIDVCE